MGFQQVVIAQKPTGYKIDVNIKPFQNKWVYLASYYGASKELVDSAFLDANSYGVFEDSRNLKQGLYLMASPNKAILFEMLVTNNQQFSIYMDTLKADQSLKFIGSEENDQLMAYTHIIALKAKQAEEVRKEIEAASDSVTKNALQKKIDDNMKAINDYRLTVIKNQAESMLALLFKAMQEVPYPIELQKPKTMADSMAQYRYGKEHYWDNIDFADGRLVRTPIFEDKLKNYLNNWVEPYPDSIIIEMNWMMAIGRNDPEMSRYLISYFVNNYSYPKIRGQEKVFLEAYQRYVANNNPASSWLSEYQRKIIAQRANLLTGN